MVIIKDILSGFRENMGEGEKDGIVFGILIPNFLKIKTQ